MLSDQDRGQFLNAGSAALAAAFTMNHLNAESVESKDKAEKG